MSKRTWTIVLVTVDVEIVFFTAVALPFGQIVQGVVGILGAIYATWVIRRFRMGKWKHRRGFW